MSHFARVKNNIVTSVIVAEQDMKLLSVAAVEMLTTVMRAGMHNIQAVQGHVRLSVLLNYANPAPL